MENEYKDTPLGLIPNEWEVGILGELANIQTGYSFPSANFTNIANENLYSIIRIRDIPRMRTYTYFQGDLDADVVREYMVAEGNILIGMDGNFHIARWSNQNGLLNQRVARLQDLSSRLYEDFAYYAIKTPLKIIEDEKHYTTVKHLSISDLRELSIPLPPLPEQRAIAHVLSTVRKAIESTEQVIVAARELKRSLMKYLFTYGPVPIDQADQVVLKETEIGSVPEEWEVTKLGEISKVIRGASPRPKGDPRYYGGDIPRLMVADVTRDLMYVTPIIDFLTVEGAKKSRPLNKGSLVVQVSGNPGTPAILAVDACIHDGFAGFLDLKDEIVDVEFLFYHLHLMKDIHKRLAFGAVFQNLQTYAIKDFVVPLPSMSSQKEITKKLAVVNKKIRIEEQQKSALKFLFSSLLHHLMTGKVRINQLTGFSEQEEML